MSAKGYRHSHCRKGHEYTPETTWVYADGRRECRTCMKARQRRWVDENRKDRREYQRMWSAGKRRERGVVEMDNNRWRNRKAPVLPNTHEDWSRIKDVPAAPFAAWLREDIGNQEMTKYSLTHRVSDKLLREVLNGERETVALDSIDQVLTVAGEPWMLEEMYPLGIPA